MTSAAEPAYAARTEIRSLTGLRILAAVWVVLFHFGTTPGVHDSPFWQPVAPVSDQGAIGVDLFYVLSGFVIALSYLDALGPRLSGRASVGFLWARICRVWPVYAAVTTLFGGWMILRELHGRGHVVAYQAVQPVLDLPHYLEQLAMVQLWHRPFFDGSSWVGPAWSISAEWLAYVCFPVLALLLWRARKMPATLTGLLAVASLVPLALICLRTGSPYHPWSWLLRIAAGFTAGALVQLTVRRIRPGPRVEAGATAVAALTASAIVAGLYLIPTGGAPDGPYRPMAVVVLFPVLVGALALSTRGPSRLLATRPFVHGGRISYSLYLVHVPVLEVAWTAMAVLRPLAPGGALHPVLVPATLVVAGVLAHLAYRRLEEPARRALRSRGPGAWSRRAGVRQMRRV